MYDMWFVLMQLPVTWLMYKLGFVKLDSPDATLVFFLMLWNMEPIFAGRFPRSVMGIARLTIITFMGSLFLYCILGLYWTMRVKAFVPEPYLDEVFHIPQAQAYCKGRWDHWDDKITTPPGLYYIAVLYHRVLGHTVCTVNSLRHVNYVGIFFIHHLAFLCRKALEPKPKAVKYHRELHKTTAIQPQKQISYFNYHSATNIAAFPVLFFFAPLFYTDVWSTVAVLLLYLVHHLPNQQTVWKGLLVFVLGVATLFMRQTNVFWVAVYMGGQEAVAAVQALKPWPVKTPQFSTLGQLVKFYIWRYSIGDIHDPPLCVAYPDDWLLSGLSIAIAIVCNPVTVLKRVWPYLSVVGLFASFVGWNGGVVLGDKSNHVATLHLAQLLYIWPFFAFFSAPLLIPPALSWSSRIYKTLYDPPMVTLNRTPREFLAKDASAALRSTDFFIRRLFYPIFILGAVVLSIVIVKYNTIIHPFTLADNRHYMFYIFRYTIRRSQLIRFALIPAYIISARLVWNRLAGLPCESDFMSLSRKDVQYVNRPFPRPNLVTFLVDERRSILARMPGTEQLTAQELKNIMTWVNETELRPGATPPSPAPQPTPRQPPSPPQKQSLIDLEDDASTSSDSPLTSTALLWLAATTLSLMTAPLVEPRYFILPWIFWRLLLPAWPTMYKAPQGSSCLFGWLTDISRRYDLTIFLETIWFATINYATFWVFLNKPFVWKAEDGTLLDGGRTQRFMW